MLALTLLDIVALAALVALAVIGLCTIEPRHPPGTGRR